MMLARWVTAVTLGVALSGGLQVSGQSQTGSASAPKALSRVTKLDITSRRPAFGGKSFGAAGAYEILIGTAQAVADPKAALNAGIVDLDKAPRNAAGLVEYSFDVQILKPVDIGKGNGTLLYEINNRANRPLYGYFDEGGPGYEADNAGNGFLMNNGYTYVASGWMHGTKGAANPLQLWASLPVASNNGRPITGTAMEEWMEPGTGAFGKLSYPAATLDQTKATLTYREHQDDSRQTLAGVAVVVRQRHDGQGHAARGHRCRNDLRVRVRGEGFCGRGSGLCRDARFRVVHASLPRRRGGQGQPALREWSASTPTRRGRRGVTERSRGEGLYLSGVQPRHGGAQSVRRHERRHGWSAQDVHELSVRPAGPLDAPARGSPLPDQRVSFHVREDHRPSDGQDGWTSGQVFSVEHVPERDPGRQLRGIVRRPRFARRDRHKRTRAPTAGERAALPAVALA